MVQVFNVIRQFSAVPRLSKHEQIVEGILMSIEDRIVERGQILPSINQMSAELGFARKTVDRAYGELKDRGVVESKNRRGFFVSTEATDQTLRVALLLYEFRPFQEVFYNVFRQTVGENVQVDTFFHHNNLSVFEDIIVKISGSYGLYVVAPIVNEQVPSILSRLIQSRLLLVDRYTEPSAETSYVIQEFEESTYAILTEQLERISKYDQIELLFRKDEEKAYPREILSACRRFASENNIELVEHDRYVSGMVRRGVLYITVGDNDLWELLEDCIDRGLALGKDLGVLSHNESRIKKIVHGGVSTWSTDFGRMAEVAAHFVLERKHQRTVIPTVFIDRQSF